jgi:GT2 family glycosyltransferase
MFTDLCIVIVNWNLKEDTLECVDSLLSSGVTLNQIILVDNGSTDGSVQIFKEHHRDEIAIIESQENVGYAAGANLGIKQALDQHFNWVLLLNNDTIVATNFLTELHKAILDLDGYAIINPLILYHSNRSMIWSAGDKQIDHTLLTTHPFKNRQLSPGLPIVVPIDFPSGCAMMVKREIFEKIGLLDPTLFMYGEEVDFCWRAKMSGYQFACYTPASVWHKVSKSSNSVRPRTRYLQIRNQSRFYRRYAPGPWKWFYFIFTFFRTLYFGILDLLKNQVSLINPAFRGWLDGWFSAPVTQQRYK